MCAGVRRGRVLPVLGVLAVLCLWTAESAWHVHADNGDHHSCPACQSAHQIGTGLASPTVATVFAPVVVIGWLVPFDANRSPEAPARSISSPRGPPSCSLV